MSSSVFVTFDLCRVSAVHEGGSLFGPQANSGAPRHSSLQHPFPPHNLTTGLFILSHRGLYSEKQKLLYRDIYNLGGKLEFNEENFADCLLSCTINHTPIYWQESYMIISIALFFCKYPTVQRLCCMKCACANITYIGSKVALLSKEVSFYVCSYRANYDNFFPSHCLLVSYRM